MLKRKWVFLEEGQINVLLQLCGMKQGTCDDNLNKIIVVTMLLLFVDR